MKGLPRCAAMVLALVGWLPGIASPQQDSTAEERRRIVSERIEEARAQGGPYSKELIDPLTSLAEIYQESGNHDLVAAVTEQAMQVIRANYGLRSLDQAPLIRERIQSEEARGNAAEAWDLEQALLTLARANPDDLRSAQIFSEIGDKRIALLRRFNAGEFPPQIQLGCYYKVGPSEAHDTHTTCSSGNRTDVRRALLTEARKAYVAAIRVLLGAGQYASAELHDLELDLVRSTYSYINYSDSQAVLGRYYETGRQSLRRLLAYEIANDQPPAERADALLQIADWDLLHDHRPLALRTYEQTYELLSLRGVERPVLDELFSPDIPVVLPAFQPNPLVTPPSDEHIDISFEITRYGASERVEVLAKTANVSEEAEEELVRLVERERFRPRVVDGELARSAPVVVRYYVRD